MKTTKLSMQQVESRIYSIFSSAKLQKSSAECIREEYSKLSAELNSRTKSGKLRYSKFMNAYAFGYRMALNNRLWRDDLEFCYVFDGIIYSTHERSSHKNAECLYYKGSDFMDSLDRGHYWKNSSVKFA
jgi:hypothetical protein